MEKASATIIYHPASTVETPSGNDNASSVGTEGKCRENAGIADDRFQVTQPGQQCASRALQTGPPGLLRSLRIDWLRGPLPDLQALVICPACHVSLAFRHAKAFLVQCRYPVAYAY